MWIVVRGHGTGMSLESSDKIIKAGLSTWNVMSESKYSVPRENLVSKFSVLYVKTFFFL